jgi:hypothetical protein
MLIKTVPAGSEVNIWLKDSCIARLQLNKYMEPYYELVRPSNKPEFKALVGTVVANNVDSLSLQLSVCPMGVMYLPRPNERSGSLTLPYDAIKTMRVLSARSEFPPRTRHNSNRTLIDGLTYRTAQIVVLAW